MRFGVAVPDTGPLSEPAALEATARAARELDYASVWAYSTRQLIGICANVGRLPVGWLVSDLAAGQRLSSLDGVLREARVARCLGSRLKYVGAHESQIGALRQELPGCVLLDTAPDPPDSDRADGWSPHHLSAAPPGIGQGRDRPPGVLILRMVGRPSTAELREAQTAQVDELVVALPMALTLDDQLAGFADIAERAAVLQNAG